MDQLKTALEKAKVIDDRGRITREARKGLRKRFVWKNRFDDIANFETWLTSQWPPDWPEICGFCGTELKRTKIQVQPRHKLQFFSCWKCYEYSRKKYAIERLR